MDIDECDSISTHSSVIPPGDLSLVPCDSDRGIFIHKEVIVCSTSSHHVHPSVSIVQVEKGMDTANIHSAIRSQKSSSEREIQKLDTVVSYSLENIV